jgi:hypothetical protein
MHVYEEIQTDFEVSLIGSGAAVVFSNSMPHRFRQIHNLTQDDGRRRTFLNFFIVDPDQPIHHRLNERILAPIDTVFEILHHWSQGRMPDVVYNKFIQLVKKSSAWETQEEAKEFRACVRRAILEDKSGWGYIQWGNLGTVEFVRTLCIWDSMKRREIDDHLAHTESD